MTPVLVFPAYPLLLTAPFAGNLINAATVSGYDLASNRATVAACALATQGTGCLIAFSVLSLGLSLHMWLTLHTIVISAAFMYRLMTQKLPQDMQRPGIVCFSTEICGKGPSDCT